MNKYLTYNIGKYKKEITLLQFGILLFLFSFSSTLNAQYFKKMEAAAPVDPPGKPPETGQTLSLNHYSGSLNFGTFYYQNAGGTITLDPVSGNSSTSGDIILFNSLQSVPVFELFAQNNTSVVISSPTTFKLIGSGPLNSGNELDVTVQFDKTSYQSVDKFTPVYIYMGGTLTVDNLDNPGPYSGTINVTVAFE